MQWHLLNSTIPQSLTELTKILTQNLDVKDEKSFFQPKHPLELTLKNVEIDSKQVKLALERIIQAHDNEGKIVVFGDYDADGVTATGILWQTLHDLGCKVTPFIPHRAKHGYGLSDKALDDLLDSDKPDLIITVDNGIVAHAPAKRVMDAGIDLIITDHHQPEDTLPPALAHVHSTKLCGASVAWMLSRELMTAFKKEIDKNWQLDLAAIATIADQVPLRGANRSFAKYGLAALRKSKRLGIRELLVQSRQQQTKLTSQAIGFSIAPRINAMGRLGHSLDALRLLLTTNKKRAQALSKTLGQTNSRRQEMTYDMFGEALLQAKEMKDENILIVKSTHFHEGVIGLIAGRLMEKFYKPAIAITISDGIAKASARSVAGVNIVELIREVRDELLEVGGHPMAAGFGLKEEHLESVINRLQTLAREKIDPKLLEPSVEVACVLPFELMKLEAIDEVYKLAPFGQGNREPIFGFKDLKIVQILTMGSENQHLKITALGEDGVTPIQFLYWRRGYLAEKLEAGQQINVAGVLEINEWRDRRNVQVRVIDINTQLDIV